MTHEEIKILISAYFDGEVTPSERNIVEEHLKQCVSCQKDHKMYKAMSSSLSKWSDETLSPDEEIKVQKRFEQRREPMFTKRNLMTLGTTLALTIIVGSVVQLQLKRIMPERLKSGNYEVRDQLSAGSSSQLRARELSYDARSASMAQSVPYYMANASGAAGGVMEAKKLWNGPASSNAILDLQAQSSERSDLNSFDRKVIRNAEITLKVQNAEKTQSALEGLVTRFNGVINSFDVGKLEDGSRQGTLIFSVPPKDLDSLLRELRKLGEVQSENQVGSDITNQYDYLQDRLENYKAMKLRLQKVLDKNAKDVENNLYIQGQISNVDRNIDSLDNNLKNLDEQSYMAKVTVNFYDTVEIIHKELSFKDKIASTFKDSLKNSLLASYDIAINSFGGIVIVLSFLAQILFWALLFWGIYRLVRKIFKK